MEISKGIKKITVAVDLGPDSNKVVAYALWLAGRFPGEKVRINLLYVIDFTMTPPPYMIPYIEKERKQDEEELGRLAESVRKVGFEADCTVATGRLVETFIKAVDEVKPDMIVLGYKSHLIRPSSSERLVKSIRIPMLVVRGNRDIAAGVRIEKIMCPVDFSSNSRHAFDMALELNKNSNMQGSKITAVNIVSEMHMAKLLKNWASLSKEELEEFRQGLLSDAENDLEGFVEGYTEGVLRLVEFGIPHERISMLATERGADLIVMGARGLSYLKSVMLGSASEATLKAAPCPVLIVH